MLSRLLTTKVLLYVVLALAVVACVLGALYRDSRAQLALSTALCKEEQSSATFANNTLTAETQAKALSDRVTQLQSDLERSDRVTKDAVARAKEAEKTLSEYRKAQNGQKDTDETYASWANERVPAGVAERLRAIKDPGAVHAGRSD